MINSTIGSPYGVGGGGGGTPGAHFASNISPSAHRYHEPSSSSSANKRLVKTC